MPLARGEPQNVQLYDTLEAAKASGFRPCKRCNPDGRSIDEENTALVARACRLIEQSEEEPSLTELGRAVGRSPRLFSSPVQGNDRDYAEGLRGGTSRGEGPRSAGGRQQRDRSHLRCWFQLKRTLLREVDRHAWNDPQAISRGRRERRDTFAVGQSSLGAILVASSKKGVAAILLGDDPEELLRNLQDRFPKAYLIGADKDYEALVARVVGFVEAPRLGPRFAARRARHRLPAARLASAPGNSRWSDPFLRGCGSPHWRRQGHSRGRRACVANGLAVAIPCHRVVKNDGSLSGYAWGVEAQTGAA